MTLGLKESTKRIFQICGHVCKEPCGRPCLCRNPCQAACAHSSCPKRCGEPCEPCQVLYFFNCLFSHFVIRCPAQEAVNMGDATTFAARLAQETPAMRTVPSCCLADTHASDSVGSLVQINVPFATQRILISRCFLVPRMRRVQGLSTLLTVAT